MERPYWDRHCDGAPMATAVRFATPAIPDTPEIYLHPCDGSWMDEEQLLRDGPDCDVGVFILHRTGEIYDGRINPAQARLALAAFLESLKG